MKRKFNQIKVIAFSLLLTGFSISASLAQEGLIPDDIERQALIDLYQNTNGDLWWDNTGWLSEDPVETWYGITKYNGDIVVVDLSFNDLEGQIPESLYNLTELEELWLEYNYLEGPLSNKVGDLEKLRYLGLRFNYFNGRLPNTIGNLQELVFLDLFENNFDGSIPDGLYTLSQLEELYLAINSLGGTISSDISGLINLRVLQIEDNLFEGEIPLEIGFCSNLEDVFLGFNLFSGSLPKSMKLLSNLSVLDIDGTPFTGSLPDFHSEALIYGLYIDGSKISSLGNLASHSNLDQIVFFDVEGGKLDFGDLEPFFDNNGNPIPAYSLYYPQDSVNTYFDAENHTFSVEVDGIHNQYQWMKDGVEISGANSSQLVLSQGEFDNSSNYQCKITNSKLTDLTLFSKSKAFRPGEYYAVMDGYWRDPIWAREKNGEITGEVPSLGSKVFIVGQDVQVLTAQECDWVEVIVEERGASLIVNNADLTIHGELRLTKITEGLPGDIKVTNNGRIKTVE